MSVSLNDRMNLVQQLAEESASRRIKEADARLNSGLEWVWINGERARIARQRRRKIMGRVGILLIAASALVLFLILKGMPILRALNY